MACVGLIVRFTRFVLNLSRVYRVAVSFCVVFAVLGSTRLSQNMFESTSIT